MSSQSLVKTSHGQYSVKAYVRVSRRAKAVRVKATVGHISQSVRLGLRHGRAAGGTHRK